MRGCVQHAALIEFVIPHSRRLIAEGCSNTLGLAPYSGMNLVLCYAQCRREVQHVVSAADGGVCALACVC